MKGLYLMNELVLKDFISDLEKLTGSDNVYIYLVGVGYKKGTKVRYNEATKHLSLSTTDDSDIFTISQLIDEIKKHHHANRILVNEMLPIHWFGYAEGPNLIIGTSATSTTMQFARINLEEETII